MATLTPDGRAAHLVSSLGSSSDERAWDVAAAGNGSVRITGYTGAASFPGGSAPQAAPATHSSWRWTG